ncbi:hypothetical protein ACTXT7_005564, partial [Hymenolepis weldensis]
QAELPSMNFPENIHLADQDNLLKDHFLKLPFPQIATNIFGLGIKKNHPDKRT